MTEFSARLRRQGHHESSEILSRERSVMSRRSKVKQAVTERRAKLDDCRKLMVFLQDCNEVSLEILVPYRMSIWMDLLNVHFIELFHPVQSPGQIGFLTMYYVKLLKTDAYFFLQAESWINEKLQVANDKSFQDPTNLENKLQRHQEFVAEVNANEQRIQKIAKVSD